MRSITLLRIVIFVDHETTTRRFSTNPVKEVREMHSACPLSSLAPGDAIRLETSPPIAVFHTEEGELFALDDTCTHQDASLADGWVEDCWVECPSMLQSSISAREPPMRLPPNCPSGSTKSW
ncbi:3-phenylpropionate/cinnamic acid dioxygenase ferredoxin subunit [Arthrobacter sp. Hiyo8]|nr:3-phenylpropionate/cinnamic acid dioxygenase ferredoxin subunit [Arthrobacter sp. Hiyo8]